VSKDAVKKSSVGLVKFEQILEERKKSLHKSKAQKPLSEIKKELNDVEDPKDFKKALQNKDKFPIICEYKPASPSLGDISSRDIKETLQAFEKGGASAVSILTEEKFFKGKLDYISQASQITSLPIMRKDFLMDEYQIFEARAFGASSVLLMSEIYPDLASGIETCHSLGMEPLIECKNSIQIYKSLEAGAEIVGINNRSFEDFSIDLQRTQGLAPLVGKDKVLVSESGIKTPEDVKLVCGYGVDAILVGTSVMESSDVVTTINKMLGAAQKTLNEMSPIQNPRIRAKMRSRSPLLGRETLE
jgi:indole-3-glycerol phosphate synthase